MKQSLTISGSNQATLKTQLGVIEQLIEGLPAGQHTYGLVMMVTAMDRISRGPDLWKVTVVLSILASYLHRGIFDGSPVILIDTLLPWLDTLLVKGMSEDDMADVLSNAAHDFTVIHPELFS